MDQVQYILEQWAVQRPDLDVSPMGIIGRTTRLAALLDSQLRPVFAAAGLGEGEFDVLAAIRRSGGALTAGEIGTSTMVTSGAVTKRVDRLLARGLVHRMVDEDDNRIRRVGLTAAGLRLVDTLVESHLDNERRLLGGLDAREQQTLAALLRRWAQSLGDEPAT